MKNKNRHRAELGTIDCSVANLQCTQLGHEGLVQKLLSIHSRVGRRDASVIETACYVGVPLNHFNSLQPRALVKTVWRCFEYPFEPSHGIDGYGLV